MHQLVASFDRNGTPVVAQINQFQNQAPNETTMNFRGVQEREPHSSILTLSGQMGHEIGWGENHFVGDEVLVF
jgi:hypothetical protein